MKAYYDLACSPPTYDVIAFLAEVERERLARGESMVEIIILPGPASGFRADHLWPPTVAERVSMLYRVAEPICWLLPSVTNVTVATERPADGFGVGVSLYGLPRQVRCSAEGIRPLRVRQPVERGSSLVTITLRESDHWPERNSQVDEWQFAARQIAAQGWEVVVIRDTCKAGEPFGPFQVDARASVDIGHRAALYARATVNLGISNGPMWLALAMNAPVLMLRPTDDRLGGVYGAEQFERCGIQRGGQIPGAPPWQRLAWKPDMADEILAAFDAFTKDNGLVPSGPPVEWRDADEVEVRVAGNTTELAIREHIAAAVARGLPKIGVSPEHDGHAVLVGGGPSLEFTVSEVRRRQKNGQKVVALNGAGKWLAERGINPDYICILDARPSNAAFCGPACTYLIASQCAPEVFDAALAASSDVRMWHFADPDLADCFEQIDPGAAKCGGGITVGLTSMALMFMIGFRREHLYGYDSSDADGVGHAYKQAENPAESRRVAVRHGAREFMCSLPMYQQASNFPQWANALANEGVIITVHGDGLLPSIAHDMASRGDLEEGMAA